MRKWAAYLSIGLGLLFLTAFQAQARTTCYPTPRQCLASIGVKVMGKVVLEGRVERPICPGRGLMVRTSHGQRIVYGLGPRWYWKDKGVERPWPGEWVKIKALKVKTPNGSYLVAQKVKIFHREITLRDPKSGLPLWRRWHRLKDRKALWFKKKTCMAW